MRPALRGRGVAVRVAPACLASWTASPPTAPPAPLTRMLCPAFRLACSNSDCQAVVPAEGSAAASASSTARGAAASASAGAAAYSAAAPGAVTGQNATTGSPALQPLTPSPAPVVTPAPSY